MITGKKFLDSKMVFFVNPPAGAGYAEKLIESKI